MDWWNKLGVPLLCAIFGGLGLELGKRFLIKRDQKSLDQGTVTVRILETGDNIRQSQQNELNELREKFEELHQDHFALQRQFVDLERSASRREAELLNIAKERERVGHRLIELMRSKLQILQTVVTRMDPDRVKEFQPILEQIDAGLVEVQSIKPPDFPSLQVTTTLAIASTTVGSSSIATPTVVTKEE